MSPEPHEPTTDGIRYRLDRRSALAMAAAVIAVIGVGAAVASTPNGPSATAGRNLAGAPSQPAGPLSRVIYHPGIPQLPLPSPSPTGLPTPSPSSWSPPPSPSPSSTGGTGGSPQQCVLGPEMVPTCGALFGLYRDPGPGENWVTAYTDYEAAMGRPFDIVKQYHDWEGPDSVFPNGDEQQLGANGQRILWFAWESNIWGNPMQKISWSAIASGAYDSSIIDPAAARVRAWGRPVFISFDHEMDNPTFYSPGESPADYVAAYRHIVDRFRADGAENVIWVWDTDGDVGRASTILADYPGDDYVDWVAYDPYNWYSCHNAPWKTPAQTFTPFYDWLMQNGFGDKPFMLGEYNSVAGPATARPDWFSQLSSGVQGLPNIKAVVLFDSPGICGFSLNDDSDSADAFLHAGQDTYFTEARPAG